MSSHRFAVQLTGEDIMLLNRGLEILRQDAGTRSTEPEFRKQRIADIDKVRDALARASRVT
jgi:hypothetical protein